MIPYLPPASDSAEAERPAFEAESAADRPPTERGRKPRPNHQMVLRAYRAMTPERKLQAVFDLNERVFGLMKIGLRIRYPDLDDDALQKVYLRIRARCHNRGY